MEHIAPALVVIAVRAGLRGVAPQAGRALPSPSQHRQHVPAVFKRRRAHTVLRDVSMLPASLRNGTCRHEGGAVRCVDLRHGALLPLRHGCTCRRRRRSTSCGALQVTTTRRASCSSVLSSPSMRRPGPRGETGAGRDELLWRLEDEDAAVRDSVAQLRCAHAY